MAMRYASINDKIRMERTISITRVASIIKRY